MCKQTAPRAPAVQSLRLGWAGSVLGSVAGEGNQGAKRTGGVGRGAGSFWSPLLGKSEGADPTLSFSSRATSTLSFGRGSFGGLVSRADTPRKAEIKCGGSLTVVPPPGPLRPEGRTSLGSRCLSRAWSRTNIG